MSLPKKKEGQMDSRYYTVYSSNNIRAVANRFTKKYADLKESHIYWVAKELNIYPDGIPHKKTKCVDMAKTGKINRDNTEYVSGGKLSDKGVQAIESYLLQEGNKAKEDYKEEVTMKQDAKLEMKQDTNIWEQVDLLSMMKIEYDKVVAERDAAKSEANTFAEMVDKYEKEIEDLKDKLLISEKENSALKTEKIELGKMQTKSVDFSREIESLQKRIAQYNAEINAVSAEVNEFRKDVSVLMTGVSQLQEKRKKLEGVMTDLVGCSKRLMNMK